MTLMHTAKWLDEEIGNMFGEIESTTESEFEVSGNLAEICHESYDGFSPYTNGGVDFTAAISLDYLVGTGKGFVNAKVSKEIEKTMDYCYTSAREQFIKENREALNNYYTFEELDANTDEVNYHKLYELDLGTLAESLSEMEQSWQDSVLFIQHRAMFYSADNSRNDTGEDEIAFRSGVNLDYDYGRDKGILYTFEETVKVGDLTPNKVKEILNNMLQSI